jgi:hypothetical protein
MAGWQYCGVTSPTALRRLPAWSSPVKPRRALAALGLAAAVLGLHALLLGRWPPPTGPARGGEPAAPLQVRQLLRTVPAAAAVDAATPPQAAAPLPVPAAARPKPTPTAPRVPAAALQARYGAEAPDEPMPATPDPTAAGQPVPVYATRLPPAATLQYAMQRDAPTRRELQAELRWRPEGERYTLSLGFAAIGRASVGALDLHGIAPERHVETRRGRELRAVNFQRDTARITFSGPALELALLPGVQDRLSWMLQLAAVMAANPALAEPGVEVLLQVVGVRGDAAVWRFVVQGREDIDLPAGVALNALHLHREPQRPYDTRVDVWLDPARHHLPVRVRLQTRAEGEGTDFTLLSYTQP